jgi:hypothetical protein
MKDCKFHGFRRIIEGINGCKVVMEDCVVELTMKGAYGGEGNAGPLVSNLMSQWLFKSTQGGTLCSC